MYLYMCYFIHLCILSVCHRTHCDRGVHAPWGSRLCDSCDARSGLRCARRVTSGGAGPTHGPTPRCRHVAKGMTKGFAASSRPGARPSSRSGSCPEAPRTAPRAVTTERESLRTLAVDSTAKAREGSGPDQDEGPIRLKAQSGCRPDQAAGSITGVRAGHLRSARAQSHEKSMRLGVRMSGEGGGWRA